MTRTASIIEQPTDDSAGASWWLRTIVSWILLFATVAILVVTIVIPFVANAERFTVLTGSMRPTYPPGTLIVVKPADADELRIGTAITYQLEPGQPAVVTHRITGTSQNGRGERTFITQGDANDSPDREPVIAEQIRGKVWYSIPYLGYVNNWLTGQQRAWIIGTLVIGLFGYAFVMVVGSVRDGLTTRRARAATEVQGETDHVSRD